MRFEVPDIAACRMDRGLAGKPGQAGDLLVALREWHADTVAFQCGIQFPVVDGNHRAMPTDGFPMPAFRTVSLSEP